MTPRVLRLLSLVAVVLGAPASAVGASRSYAVDPMRSRAVIAVGKSGVFSFAAGHTHEVVARVIAGTIDVDRAEPAHARVRLEIDAAALEVTGKGDPPKDVPEVQRTMAGPEVLDVKRYPRIVFESTSVAARGQAAEMLDLLITGRLTLHGVTRSISVPVTVRLEADRITATGRFPLKQTDYGIKPISVGGVVSVKDALDITFTIVGR
jgi:polyisoprenoid-binding protein YceI